MVEFENPEVFDPSSDDFLDPFPDDRTDPTGGPILVTPAGSGVGSLGRLGQTIAGAVGLGVTGVGSEGDNSVDDIYRGVTGETSPDADPGNDEPSATESVTRLLRLLLEHIDVVAGVALVLGAVIAVGQLFEIQIGDSTA